MIITKRKGHREVTNLLLDNFLIFFEKVYSITKLVSI